MSRANRQLARILIMAGGTGGHVFPALAVAEQLRQQGVEIFWLGTQRGLESRLVPKAEIKLFTLPISGLRGNGALGWLLAPLRISIAIVLAIRVLISCRAEVVLGMGGFVTGPGGIAAWLLRRPLVIHEQNAIAGLTNKLLARFASCVIEAFPGAFKPGVKAKQTGNPVRADIAAIAPPAQRLASHTDGLRVLVIGGSLGAQVLNQTVPQAIAQFDPQQRPVVRHQAGQQGLQLARDAYQAQQVDAEVTAFIDDMAEAYAWADVVICRAGALTIAELAAAGVAAVLIPLPHAVDDHQTANARFLQQCGGAVLMPQSEFTAQALYTLLKQYAEQPAQLLTMAQAARQQSRPAATDDVTRLCMQAIQGGCA